MHMKKLLAAATLLCLLPVLAYASTWFFSTQVRSSGGTITSRNMANQRVVNGSVFRSYTTSAPLDVTVTADPGFSIRDVTVDGTPVNGASLAAAAGSYSTTVQGMTDQSVTATFIAASLTVRASIPGGTVSPQRVGNVTYGYTLTSPLTFQFTPSPGYQITGIANLPTDARVTHTSFSPGINLPVKVTFGTGYVFTSSLDLQATVENRTPSVAASLPQTVIAGQSVTVTAFATNCPDNATFTWSYVSGPANQPFYPSGKVTSTTSFTPGPAIAAFPLNGASATFTAPGIPGQYKFVIVVSAPGRPDLGSLAVVNVFASADDAVKNQCQFCHTANGIGGPQFFSNWSASVHRAKAVTCAKCHTGTNTGGHPGSLTRGAVSETTFNYNALFGSGNFCVNCHNPAIVSYFAASPHVAPAGNRSCSFCHAGGAHNPSAGCIDCHYPGNSLGLAWPPAGLDFHNSYNGTNLCSTCHNTHNPKIVTGMSGPTHYNNITSGRYPASYITSRAGCTDCHASGQQNAVVRHQWDRSGHGATNAPAFTYYDFKTMSGCVQCHTTTGFIAYSTGRTTAAWGTSSDKTKEVLACNGCHSDTANGVVRTVSPVKPFADDDYLNRDVGTSNICMSCHSGRNNGLSIASGDFTNQPFIAPHYLAAGGVLHGTGGYHFPGQSYHFYSSNTHRTIGMANADNTGSAGPCAGCHMSTPQKHLFQPVSSAGNGTVAKITSNVCANCHGATLDDATLLNADKASFSTALEVLKQTLAYRGFNYVEEYPYFTSTNWAATQDGAQTMGAAFNYVLLLKEPGAYAHNQAYAKQLVFNSIDYLYNGTVTGSIDSAADGLVGNGISQAQADSLKAYQASNSCSSCHANTSGSHPIHLSAGLTCVSCHSATAQGNTALAPGTISHINGAVDLSAGPAVSFGYAAGNCSNISCHNNTSARWGSTLACSTCHGYPPPNAAPGYKVVDESASPHLKHAGQGANYSYSCSECHKGNAHGNGSFQDVFIDKNGILAGANASYAANTRTCTALYCHSDGTTRATGQAPAASVAWGSGKLTCSGCHGYPPSYPNQSPKANSHANHAFTCNICHAATTSDGSTIAGHGQHVNGSYEVAPGSGVSFSYSYAGTGGSCASISCHGGSSATWGTTLSCTTCHGNPPPSAAIGYHGVDETASPHLKHAGQDGGYSYACDQCHKGSSHGSGNFQAVFINTTSILAGRSATYDGATHTCSALYCHSDGTSRASGEAAVGSVVWGSSKLACSGCHGYPPSYVNQSPKANSHASHSFGCSSCHFNTTTDGSTIAVHAQHVNGSYDVTPGTGVSFSYSYAGSGGSCASISCHGGSSAVWGTTLSCTSCHGNPPPNAAAGYTGLDETISPHLKHAAQDGNYSYACDQCHKGNSHGNGNFQEVFLNTTSTLAGRSATYNGPMRTCTSLYCHSDGTNRATGQPAVGSATWDSTKLTCSGCHGYPPTYANQSPKANSHPNHNFGCNVCHSATTTDGSTITAHGQHVNGRYDVTAGSGASFSYSYAGTGGSCANISCHGGSSAVWGSPLSCTTCHGYPPPNAAVGYNGVDESSSPHLKHAGQGANYSFFCSECHRGNSHGSGNFQAVFLNTTGIMAGRSATYNGVTRSCSGLYCHSDGTNRASGQPAVGSATWGAGKLTCSGCHGYPPSYAHQSPKANSHANHSFGCNVCHSMTTVDGSTISGHGQHVNGSYDVTPGSGVSFSYSYAGTGGSCASISCHGGSSAVWGTTLSCTSCHGNPPPNAAVGYSGVDETSSPHLKHAAQDGNYGYACDQCHKGNSHGSGNFQAVFINTTSILAGRSATYNGATRTCSALYCHSDGTNRATGQPATASAVWGSTKLTCSGCHGYPPSYANQSPKANSHANHNFGCNICHSATTTDGSTISAHGQHVNGSYDVTPGSGVSFSYSYAGMGGSCASISCHGGSSAVWGSTLTCTSCHGYPPPNAAAGYSGADETSSPHLKHAAKDGNYSYSCDQCHKGSSHGSGNYQAVFLNTTSILAGRSAAYNGVTRTCSSLYCHSDGTNRASGQPAVGSASWGSGKLTCSGCHGYPPSYANQSPKANSHANHNFGCNVCHSSTTVDGSTISAHGQHVNGSYDVTPGSGVSFSYSYAGTGGSCASISCHGGTSAVWGTTLSCTSCHGNPPPNAAVGYSGVDETSSPHLKHAGQDGNYGYACDQCHKGNSHGSGNFQAVFINTTSILAGRSATYNGATRSCSSLYCHSDGTNRATGQPAVGSATWGSGKLSCSGCHGYPPSYANRSPKANSHANHNFGCNVCHSTTTADGSTISARGQHVNGNYDVTPGSGVSFSYSYDATGGSCANISCHGGSSAVWGSNLSCTTCHGYPPPNAAVGYSGVDETSSPHLKHAGPDGSYSYACDQCHKGNSHGSGNFQAVFINTTSILAGHSATYNGATRTCSSLYCHSDGTNRASGLPAVGSAVWGSAKLACSGCHGYPPSYANQSPKANSHANHNFGCNVCHSTTTADGSTISARGQHVNGSYDVTPGSGVSFSYSYAGTGGSCASISCHGGSSAVWGSTLSCTACHGYPPPNAAAGYSGVDETSSPHLKHAGQGGNYSYSCSECHKGNSHASGNFQAVFLNTTSIIAGRTATYNGATRTCSALYCHSDGTNRATGQPAVGSVTWGSGKLTCSGCHGYPPSYANQSPKANSHAKHNFGCNVCHSTTTTDGSTISGHGQHVNGIYDVTPGSGVSFNYSYAATGGRCADISCHGGSSAVWGTTLACNACHGYPPPNAVPNYTGVDETSSAHQKHAGAGYYGFSCDECHKGNTHATGSYQDVFVNRSGIKAGAAARYDGTTRTCSNLYCHDNGSSVATGLQAAGSVVWGTNKLACDGCHGNPPSYLNGSPKGNSHVTHNFGCGTCHAGTTADGVTIANRSLHLNGAYDLTPGPGTTFAYSYSNSGGSCSNVSCHQGIDAKWGSTINGHSVDHLAAPRSGYISVFSQYTLHEDEQETVSEDCYLCHYRNIVTQHGNNCSVCHAGANPAGALIAAGGWNKSCDACHPTFHTNVDHDSYVDVGNCTNCHTTDSPWSSGYTGDNCGWCHSPAQTAQLVIQQHPAVADAPPAAAKGNLRLQMKMDEAAWSGAVGEVKDSSGWNSNGTAASGTTTVDGGVSGRAGRFNGTGSQVTLQYPAGLTPADNFALEAWVKPNEGATIGADSEASGGTSGTGGQRFLFWPDSADDHLNAEVGVSVGTNGVSVYELGYSYMPARAIWTGTLSTSQWTHVAVVYTNRQPSIFVNGALVHTGQQSPREHVYAPHIIGGNRYDWGSGWYSGMADNVTVYDAALTPTEVLQHAQQLCTATSNAAVAIKWNSGIATSSYVDYGPTTSYGSTVGDGTLVNTHVIALTGLAADTTYHYRVRTTSATGYQTVSGDYTFDTSGGCSAVTVPPAPPGNISGSGSDTQATISWNVGAGASSSLIQYGTSSGSYTSSIDPATSPQTISNLANGVPIYYKVGDKNTAGTVWNNTEYSVMPIGPPVVTSPTVVTVGSTSATLGANVTFNGGAPLTANGICWGTSSYNPSNCADQGSHVSGPFTQTFSGLPEATTLYYRGYAINTTGATGYSSVGTVLTAPLQPKNLSFTSVGGGSFTVNWSTGSATSRNVLVVMRAGSPVNAAPVNGTYYSASSQFGYSYSQMGTGNYVVYNGTGNSVNVAGLDANTVYYVAIYAYYGYPNSSYNVASPPTGSQSTSAAALPVLTLPNSWAVYRTTASVSSSVTTTGGSPLTANGFCWGVDAAPTGNCVDQGSHTIGVFNYSLSGLIEGSAIYYRGYATNAVGTGYSADAIMYTEPRQPTGLIFSNVSNNGMTVNWTTVSTGNASKVIVVMKAGSAVSYAPYDNTTYTANAVFGSSGSQVGTGTGGYAVYKGNGNSVDVSGLTANTTYFVSIYAYSAGTLGTENYNTSYSPLSGSQAAITVAAPTLTSPTATSVAATTATLGANLISNGGATPTAKGTCWGLSAAPTGNCLDTTQYSTGVFTQSRTGLNEGSAIYYRGYAINPAGTGYSPDGIIYTEPSQPTALSYPSVTSSAMTLNWVNTSTGNAKNVLVLMKAGSAVSADPADGTTYTANPVFGSGSQIGSSGYYVVYNGNGNSVAVTGLTLGITYQVKVYAFAAGGPGTENYNLSAPLTGSKTTSAVTIPLLSSPTATSVSTTTATLGANFTSNGGATPTAKGTCWGLSAAPTGNCLDSTQYNTGVFTQGRTGLNEGSAIYYRGYAINVAGTGYSSDGVTYTEPTQPTTLTYSGVTANAMTLNWLNTSAGNASKVLVVMKAGSAVSSDPADGMTYSDNAAFASGSQIGSGNFVVYKGTGTSVAVTGLLGGTTYYIKIYAFGAGGSGTENYNVISALSGSKATSSAALPTLSTPTATSIATTTATLGVTVLSNGGALLTANGTCWGYSNNPGSYCVDQGSHATGAFTQNRTGLPEATLVYYRGYATNSTGTAYSASGSFYTEPVQPNTLTYPGVGTNGITFSWVTGSSGPARNVVVVVKAGSAVDSDPVDGISYYPNSTFGYGSQLGSGNYVVYKGTGNTINVGGLLQGTTYYVKVYAFAAGLAGTENYNVTSPLTGSQQTAAGPPLLSTPTATSVTGTTAILGANVTSNGGVALSANGTCWGLDPAPSGNCADQGAHATGVFTQSRSGLPEGSAVYYRGYATNSLGTSYSPDGWFFTEPVQPTALSWSALAPAGMTVNWSTGSTGNAAQVIVVMKAGSPVDAAPADGVSYLANAAFGHGSEIGTRNYVVYTGSGESVAISGLAESTRYYYAVYAFAGGDVVTNYNIGAPLVGSQATTALTPSLPPFTQPGTYAFAVPAGVTRITVNLQGAGGGGGGGGAGYDDNSNYYAAGGGGGYYDGDGGHRVGNGGGFGSYTDTAILRGTTVLAEAATGTGGRGGDDDGFSSTPGVGGVGGQMVPATSSGGLITTVAGGSAGGSGGIGGMPDWGWDSGYDGETGKAGGQVAGTIDVIPGEVLTIVVAPGGSGGGGGIGYSSGDVSGSTGSAGAPGGVSITY